MSQQQTEDYTHELTQQKERNIFLQAPVSNSAILAISSIAFLFFYGKGNNSFLLLWFFFMLLLTGCRLATWFYHKRKKDSISAERWVSIYTIITGGLGIVWSCIYLLGYGSSDPVVLIVVSMIFFGVSSSAASVLSMHLPLFIVYTYPQAIVFSFVLILNGDSDFIYLGISSLLFLIMLTFFARNANKQFVTSVRLQSENSGLIVNLNQEVHQREQMVNERTSELVKINKALGLEIHERINAQKETGFQVSLLNSVLNSTPDLIYYKEYVKQDGCYIGCNKAFASLCGVAINDIIGKNDIELFGEEEGKYIRAKDKVALHANDTYLYEEWATFPDGRKVLLSVLKTPFYDHNRKLQGILGIARDITEMKTAERQLKRNEQSLQHLAHHDTLTGLANRLLLIDRLKQSIKKAEREKKGLAVMFIDLDHFKEINDSLGHSIGDQLLQAVAARLKQTIRNEDTAARLGGDEFTIIIEQLENTEYASLLAEKLLLVFKQPLKLRNREITITLSIGISLFPQHGTDTETLLRNADAAMYCTKNEGRNGFSLYTEELTQRAMERVELEYALRRAIENNELEVYFQPQIDLINDKVTGCEALLRWNHPQQGLLLPGRFIELAEEIGLINEIGMWVFKTCCEKSVEWERGGVTNLKIAINISGRQLLDDKFASKIKKIIEETGCLAELLELEITEGYLIKYPEKTVNHFNEFKDIGMQIAIDDFGTGYSSLTYLKQFPISKLKIDYSFIRDILVDPNDQAITKAIIALGNSLDLMVTAEGVENEHQYDFVLAEGCDQAQGYYFARPLPELEFLQYLRSNRVKK